MTDFVTARVNMVNSQLRPNLVHDGRLLAAMERIPRERFVPASRRAVAYVDDDLDLGHGRVLMEPMVLARLLDAARVDNDESVLDVGCGSGYSTAVLASMAAAVVGVESVEALAESAMTMLAELEIDNAAVVAGPLAAGYAKQAPYDVILINGAVAALPPALVEQLAEGGRLATVIAGDARVGRAMGAAVLVTRRDGVVSTRTLFDAAVPVLPEFAPTDGFVF